MSSRGPLITLGAVVVLTAVLLVINSLIGPPPPARSGAPAPAATSAPPATTPPPATTQAVFTGVTSGKEATLAIAVNGGKAAAYLCDGQSLEAWLQGTASADTISLTGTGSAALSGSISGSAAFGTVTTATGRSFAFSAAAASPPAGIYQARLTLSGLATRVGWAVLPDGTQVGIARVGDQRRTAPSFDPGSGGFTLDGTAGTAAPVSGSDTVVGG